MSKLKNTHLMDRDKDMFCYGGVESSSHIPDNRKIVLGLSSIAFGLILPVFIQPQIRQVLENLSQSIVRADVGLLLLATNKLVFFNTLRHSPIFIGAFLLGEGLAAKFRLRRFVFFLTLMLIPSIFRAISVAYGFQFLFVRASLLTVLVILVLHFLTLRIRTIVIKIIIIFLFLSGLDWLEFVPMLDRFGFGGGDLASTIRVISAFINADYTMNYVGLSISMMLIANALILTKVVVDYYNKMSLVEKLRIIEFEAVRSRSFQEIKHLVHDLKTPLVTIQGLNEVIGLKVVDPQVQAYTERISNSVEKISLMITEILHERTLKPVCVKEIVDFLRTHLSLEELHSRVGIDSRTDAIVYANKYLFARALINVMNNGLQAIEGSDGRVHIEVLEENGKIVFSIRDNGRGIPSNALDKIWELGFSNGKSTGLGLNFVKKVVDDHHGDVQISSQIGVGTVVRICLPGVIAHNEESLGS